MAIVDESRENIIVNVPYIEDIDTNLREEERKRTGRYLAVSVILFLIGLGLYHIVSHVASRASALISAAAIMVFYLLWLWYASQRRKQKQKYAELNVEKQVTDVLEGLNNNVKNARLPLAENNSHVNYVYSHNEDEIDSNSTKREAKSVDTRFNVDIDNVYKEKLRKKRASIDYCPFNSLGGVLTNDNADDVFIRTYSVG